MPGVLAIDYGEKKSGFAVTDALRIAFEPLEPVRSGGEDEVVLAHVARLLGERSIGTIVVGLPLHMDGSEGERARRVRAFVRLLALRFPGLAIHTFDERLTSKEAESKLREAGVRGRKVRERRDSWSALVLLEDWVRSGEPTSP
jgi:putative Holliday junction resolvase